MSQWRTLICNDTIPIYIVGGGEEFDNWQLYLWQPYLYRGYQTLYCNNGHHSD
jgi:hypothetical protein